VCFRVASHAYGCQASASPTISSFRHAGVVRKQGASGLFRSSVPSLHRNTPTGINLRPGEKFPKQTTNHLHSNAKRIRRACGVAASGFGPEYDEIIQKITNPGPLLGTEEEAQTILQTILGAIGLTFFGTFGLAPKFKDTFKEEERWTDIYASLLESGVKTVDAEEAVRSSRGNGAFLLDVRMQNKFSEKSLPNAVNIPLYRPIQLTNPAALLRALGFAFFGVSNSERTPGWLEQVQETIPKNAKVYIMCNTGGSLENRPGMKFGFESQSLKAYHFLRNAGYRNLIHVNQGMRDLRVPAAGTADA